MSPGILSEAISTIMPSSTKKDPAQSTTQHKFPSEANTEAYALQLDDQEPLTKFRSRFVIPTKTSLRSTALTLPDQSASQSEQSTYFCGNSLGLQPKCTREYINAQLDTWSAIGVNGHFTQLNATPLKPWQNMSEYTSTQSAKIVGADPSEVVIMNSLTANLHLAMASFYRPQGKRNKIVLEWKAFPSDHYAIESQIRWHGLDPAECMVLLSPDEDHIISTAKIERVIDELQDEIALVLLPGLQYYTGQVFDMARITRFAHDRGLTIGWDLAHAAGNVELKLKEWDVDFAAWCTYKYMNAGPGAIAGMYVNARHGKVETDGEGRPSFRPRLMGWYGGDKQSRFKMDNKFNPIVGAAGFQLSNPSAIDLASLAASLSIFEETSMSALRQKSVHLTAYLQHLLLTADSASESESESDTERKYRIITPLDPAQRGAQLSVLLKPGLLKDVAAALKRAGIVADQREPDVVRVAPVPLYNTFWDVWYFVKVFKEAIRTAGTGSASIST